MPGKYHIDRLLREIYHRRASELRLQAGRPPRMYVARNFVEAKSRPLSAEELDDLIRQVSPDENLREFTAAGNTSFWINFGDTGRLLVQLRVVDQERMMVVRPA